MIFSKFVLIAVVSVGMVSVAGAAEKSKEAMCEDIFEGSQKVAEKMGQPVMAKDLRDAAKKATVVECAKQADDVLKLQHKAVTELK